MITMPTKDEIIARLKTVQDSEYLTPLYAKIAQKLQNQEILREEVSMILSLEIFDFAENLALPGLVSQQLIILEPAFMNALVNPLASLSIH